MDAASPVSMEAGEALASEALAHEAIEQPFVGRWRRLVSTTNWEKGRIILEWREALIAASAPAGDFSDEAWSRRVGGVTSQHVGRLRRVYHRFASVQASYSGLYWSHFQAALDWDDAEMWLEGASKQGWSVETMRRTRWESLAAVNEHQASQDEPLAQDSDVDEDYVPSSVPDERPPSADDGASELVAERADVPLPPEAAELGDEPRPAEKGAHIFADESRSTIAFVQPFQDLADLPPDLADAFDAMKLAILRHKSEGWQQISRDDTLAALDALKGLILIPSTEPSPF
jgi:hypothetical protein